MVISSGLEDALPLSRDEVLHVVDLSVCLADVEKVYGQE
jgi:hypothetical protein